MAYLRTASTKDTLSISATKGLKGGGEDGILAQFSETPFVEARYIYFFFWLTVKSEAEPDLHQPAPPFTPYPTRIRMFDPAMQRRSPFALDYIAIHYDTDHSPSNQDRWAEPRDTITGT